MTPATILTGAHAYQVPAELTPCRCDSAGWLVTYRTDPGNLGQVLWCFQCDSSFEVGRIELVERLLTAFRSVG